MEEMIWMISELRILRGDNLDVLIEISELEG